MTVTPAELLGLSPDARLLIVDAQNLGLCDAANTSVYASLRTGSATSACLMVPCPWARDAAARYRGEDVGVKLTLNAEWDRYRWGPITLAPSLLDGDGGFPRTIEDFWEHADVEEVRRECRAQIERAVLWGFDVTHLDAHLDAILLRPEFFDVYIELALDFGLPARVVGGRMAELIGFPARQLAQDAGVLVVDREITARTGGSDGSLADRIAAIGPGLTLLRVNPAADTPELRAIDTDVKDRLRDASVTSARGVVEAALADSGVTPVGYRALRDAMRRLR